MSEAVDIANREAERMMSEFRKAIDEGYELWSFWNDLPKEGDKIKTFGFMSLVKRAKK